MPLENSVAGLATQPAFTLSAVPETGPINKGVAFESRLPPHHMGQSAWGD
jgi:hypothetical protein